MGGLEVVDRHRDYSDYVVYVDESGDHALSPINKEYPVFVLAFCIFRKDEYVTKIVPAVQELKFQYFGHDLIILHERDVRKAQGGFNILLQKATRDAFMADVSSLIQESDFTIISACIRKDRLRDQYTYPSHPYHLAMEFGLERVNLYLRRRNQGDRRTHLVFERRGKKEDEQLELEFRRICSGKNYKGDVLPFEIVMADKRINSCGLQLADLVARPIGRWVLDSDQPNRAFEVLQTKLDQGPGGDFRGFGLKVFP